MSPGSRGIRTARRLDSLTAPLKRQVQFRLSWNLCQVCVCVCVCVCMHVCVHPYLVIIPSNSDSELFNIYHPPHPHISPAVPQWTRPCEHNCCGQPQWTHALSLQEVLSCGFPDLSQRVIFQDPLFPCEMTSTKTLWEPKRFHEKWANSSSCSL